MGEHNIKKIWIAWERHRRTIELNKVFSCRLFILESTLPRIIKHPILSLQTCKILHREKPKILFVQNPSFVLTLIATLFKPIYKYKLIVDAHNAGLMPTKNFLRPLKILYKFIQRKADYTIVTNEGLAELVIGNRGKPYILPDRIPVVDSSKNMELKGKAAVLYICTFGEDEPYWEVIRTAEILGKSVYIYITGDYKKVQKITQSAPTNVIFTGYLPDEEYWSMLRSVDLTLDLTLRENCLVCGAYESISAETPMVLSSTEALKNYFYKGAIFSANNAIALAGSIREALQKEDSLKEEVKELKQELSFSWEERARKILEYLKDDRGLDDSPMQ